MINISDKVVDSYVNNLIQNKIAQGFLESRGFDDLNWLILQGIGCGDKKSFYDGYITFPIYDLNNNLVSMTGRSFDGSQPKHKHLPGPIKYFYNHHQLRDDYENVIIVESPLCALSLCSIELEAAVLAKMGTKIPEFFDDLDRDHYVIIIPDSDAHGAGLKQAEKLANIIQVAEVKIAKIPLPSSIKKLDVNDLFYRDKTKTKSEFNKKIKKLLSFATEFEPTHQTNHNKKVYTSDNSWKSNYDIIEIISPFVQELEQIGSYYRCVCCFHPDTNPSLVVYPNTNSFYCWGCNKGGSVVDFVMEQFGYDFKEAKEYLRVNYD